MTKFTAAFAALALVAGAPLTAVALPTAVAVQQARPTINSTIGELLADPATAAVLEKHLPGISNHPARPQFEDLTFEELIPLSQGQVTAEMVAAIDADLRALPAT